MILGVDVGGTFTDLVRWDGERLHTAKVTTTPDQSDGVVDGSSLLGAETAELLHGTTVATNALLERKGVTTALVTDAGFTDVIEIGRQDRPSLYDPFADRPEPLVPRGLRMTAPDRGDFTATEALLERLTAAGAEAVAVSLLYSYRDPSHERELGAALAAHGVQAISLSSDVAPEFREFERTSTTVLNAYLVPIVSAYLDRLTAAFKTAVMRSSGGLIAADEAARLPASILLSGPAGGVMAAAALGGALEHDSLIAFDMGGTSSDVCRIEECRPAVAYERTVAGYPCRFPAVAVHTVGAGGGSIGWIDPGGALRVGPNSAGARPGPAAYGRGGNQPTVTDANLMLGRLAPGGKLAGDVELDFDLAVTALARLGEEIGVSAIQVALGMVTVVEAEMERAVRAVTVAEGADPRRAVLAAYGGAGGLHGSALARRLEMQRMVVPPHAGVFSAVGLILSPPRGDAARSVLLVPPDNDRLNRAVEEVARAVRRPGRAVRALVDARYVGQSHETTVEWSLGDGWDRLIESFHNEHRVRNGFSRIGDPVEVVTVRAEAVGAPAAEWDDLPDWRPEGDPGRGERPVITDAGETTASVWWRPALSVGAE
ncbi:MAG TPA: hydantoinase/oxoprolinase family protein, partial [Acidimicrobiia bacterium]|nr:hydantoinase/oxoprolinase family protein [Acidimicrobiia bacterium]